MGTSLTGLTPSTTYDALIKVGDNGPLSATAKVLSDGLGNDSPLAMSTTLVGIGTTTPVTNLDINATIAGAYTSSSSQAPLRVLNTTNVGGINSSVISMQCSTDNNASNPVARIGVVGESASSNNAAMVMMTRDGAGVTERMRITSAGNVGIGLSNPVQKFGVSDGTNAFYVTHDANGPYIQAVNNANTVYKRLTYDAIDHVFLISANERARFTANGLTFNGDTAAANALDDYEEGTFTPSIAFGGNSVGVTYFDNVGNYTKIGRQVTCIIYLALTSVGSSTGSATISGLPFTNGNANRGSQSVATCRFGNITYLGSVQLYLPTASTSISFQEVTELGTSSLLTNTNFNGSSEMSITLTYFV